MLKKILFALLAAAMVLTAAACGKDETPDNAGDTTAAEDTAAEAIVYEGTLEELLAAIYEKSPMEAMMGNMPIDLTDADALKYYLGLSDATGIKEAIVSEPMIGSIPYSLCLARVEEGADVAALMQGILDGVDMRKWMCVETDNMIVANHGDVIIMVMNNSADQGPLAADQYAAFAEIVGGEGTKLSK